MAELRSAGRAQLQAYAAGEPHGEVGYPILHLVLGLHPGGGVGRAALHDAQVLLHHVVRQDPVGQLLRVLQLSLDPVGKEGDHLHAAFVQLLVIGGVGQTEGGQDAAEHQRHGQRQNQYEFGAHLDIAHQLNQALLQAHKRVSFVCVLLRDE